MAGQVIDLHKAVEDRLNTERSDKVRDAVSELVSLMMESGLQLTAVRIEWVNLEEFQVHFDGTPYQTEKAH
jgi:hypothetical protein